MDALHKLVGSLTEGRAQLAGLVMNEY